MVSYEHKIRNIYLGGGRSPNSDTMLYIPMKTDLLDHSGKNVTMTNNGVSLNTSVTDIGVGYFDGNSRLNFPSSFFDMSTSDFTISFRCRDGAGLGSSHGAIFNNQWTLYSSLLLRYGGTKLYAGTKDRTRDIFSDVTAFSINQDKRILRTITREGSSWKVYKNSILNWSGTSSASLNYNPNYTGAIGAHEVSNPNYYIGYISEFIVEKVRWSQQEITKYYKKTRTDYGYSGKDYQEVEYIESSGTQYIDTGIKASNTISTELVMAPNMSYTSEYAIFGDGRTASALFLMEYQGKYKLHNGGVYGDMANVTNEQTTITTNSTGISINGVSYSLSAGSSYTNNNIRLFATGDGSTTNKRGHFKVYSFKIYSNNDLVRDFIPCYRISDDVIGLYDKINNVFYTNSGTGTFTKGPDVGN